MLKQRVHFPKGNQKIFLENNKPNYANWKKFSEILKINYGTLNKAYRYEYCTLPYNIFRHVCKIKNKSIQDELRNYHAFVRRQEYIKGKSAFGRHRLKISTPIFLNQQLATLDISGVKFSRYDKKRHIVLPTTLTLLLAEEIGMHIGDGFLSKRKYEYRLKGNKKDEREYYDTYVKFIYKTLYNVDLSLKEYETTYGFEIASKAIWSFKSEVLGLKPGRKDCMKLLPILVASPDLAIQAFFIRGLMDTDGSISFKTRYGFKSYYPVMSITLKSKKLVDGVFSMMNNLGLKPRKSMDRTYWRINLSGYERIALYSKVVGWSNPKHLNKVIKWKNEYPTLSMAVVVQPG